jgi:hypothetical protein
MYCADVRLKHLDHAEPKLATDVIDLGPEREGCAGKRSAPCGLLPAPRKTLISEILFFARDGSDPLSRRTHFHPHLPWLGMPSAVDISSYPSGMGSAGSAVLGQEGAPTSSQV